MKKLLTLLALFLAVVACVAPVSAAEDEQDPPAVSLLIRNRLQQTPVWCWVAVSEQLITYSQGGSPPQCALVAAANGVLPAYCCNGYNQDCVRTGSMSQVRTLLLAYGNSASDVIPPPSAKTLYRHIASNHPVVLQIRTGVASTHVVVVRGVYYVGGSLHVVINDPMSIYTQPIEYSRIYPSLVNALVVD